MDDELKPQTLPTLPASANNDKPSRSEFTHRVFIVTGVVVAYGVAVALFVLASDIFFLFFAAVLLAIILRAASGAVGRWTGLGPGWSFGLVVITLTVLLGAATYAVGSTVVAQVNQLVADLPKSLDQAREYVRQYPWGDQVLQQVPDAGELLGSANPARQAARFFSTTFGALGSLLVLIASALYLAVSPRTYISGLLALVPRARRSRAEQVLDTIGIQLEWWLLSRLVAMAAVGLIVWVGLWLIGVPQSLVLALVAGVLTAIPLFGPVIAAVPGILLAFMQGPNVALWAVGTYFLSQVIENYVITPLLQDRMVNMPPVLAIAAVSLVGALFGILGMIVSAPLAVAVVAAVKMLYIEDILGDETTVLSEDEST